MLELKSNVIVDGQQVFIDYTCDGKNILPQLFWTGVPSGAKSFSIICDDPDAPAKTWVHWVVFNMSGDQRSLPKAVEIGSGQFLTAANGVNDFGKLGYGGACPPRGHPAHLYFFKLYALDSFLLLQEGATRDDVEKAM